MSFADLLFIALVLGLPTLLSFKLFRNEPSGRPFVATYLLAVSATPIVFGMVALVLMLLGVGGLGMFDGLFAAAAAVPIALLVGVLVRRRRAAL